MEKTFFQLERETAQQRINDGIGLLTVYDEKGAFHHVEETAEYKHFANVLKCDETTGEPSRNRKENHEPLYFKVKKPTV